MLTLPTKTANGGEITYYDNPCELSVEIERPDGNSLTFVGRRDCWELIGLVVVLMADWPEPEPLPDGPLNIVPLPVTVKLPDLRLQQIELSLDELMALQESGDYTRILEAVPMSDEELALLREHVAELVMDLNRAAGEAAKAVAA